ncbi:hypothetical protein E2320_012516 [Naja naja]|nr:hypothetical protein E2320_012516 [Naja naja]
MINACRDFLDLAEAHSRKWQRALQHECEQRIRLEETIEQLAKQHNNLERACRGAPSLSANPAAQRSRGGSAQSGKAEPSDEDEETEYFDAMEDAHAVITVAAEPSQHHRHTSNNISVASEGCSEDWNFSGSVFDASTHTNLGASSKYGVALKKRRTQIPDKPNYSLNLWSIMKNCIGKELSKIPMPINFNEPLSMLQRLTEDLEYHELLDRAVKCENAIEQMCFVAAFSVSSYSTTVQRTAKPFNPLLGETFELDRLEELGFRSLCEQSGDIEILNHKSKDKCHLKFTPYSYFSRDIPRKVTGVVMDADGNERYVMSGTWDEKMECSKVIEASQETPFRKASFRKQSTRPCPPRENAENMYFFSKLALTLNEPEDNVAPTDSRMRPDQRLMENGKWDEANMEKQRLEEKQRAVRRHREVEAADALAEGKDYKGYIPLWFERKVDPLTGELMCVYKGGYWESKEKQDWSQCPSIF